MGRSVVFIFPYTSNYKDGVMKINSILTTYPKCVAPGSGLWNIVDHITQPGTPCFESYYYNSMQEGWNCGASRVGMITRLLIRSAGGFMYYQPYIDYNIIDFKQLSRYTAKYWNERLYLKAIEKWDHVVRPTNICTLNKLQSVELPLLLTNQLIHHLKKCFAITKSMVRIHHELSCPVLVPTGDIINQVCDWTGEDSEKVVTSLDVELRRLKQFSEVVSPAYGFNERPPKNAIAEKLFRDVTIDHAHAQELLNHAKSLSKSLKSYINNIIQYVGFRIVQGYDICSETVRERPDILFQLISSMYCLDSHYSEDVNEGLEDIRSKVPLVKRTKFDELLIDLKSLQRLRGERGAFSDLWAVGILRNAYLEAGARLEGNGTLSKRSLVINASLGELIGLLKGEKSVTMEKLEQRDIDRKTRNLDNTPHVLDGGGDQQPVMTAVTEEIMRSERSFGIVMTLAVDRPAQNEHAGFNFQGIGASRGTAEGPIRLIEDGKLDSIHRGDILVLKQATASLSVVLPILAGVVSENGGILSHPAILAREYKVPCVVGCAGVVRCVKPGMHIRINGTTGVVKLT
jgi:rifampicin phosphotransferase